MAGTVYLIVGASGVGKDTLLGLAQQQLTDHKFVQRYITRPSDAGGEDHIGVTHAAFERMVNDNRFCVWWHAHGLGYGIHQDVTRQVAVGDNVVINTSRSAIRDFEAIFTDVITINVIANTEVLRKRLEERGRESRTEIRARLDRHVPVVTARNLLTIDNSGEVTEAVQAMVDALTQV